MKPFGSGHPLPNGFENQELLGSKLAGEGQRRVQSPSSRLLIALPAIRRCAARAAVAPQAVPAVRAAVRASSNPGSSALPAPALPMRRTSIRVVRRIMMAVAFAGPHACTEMLALRYRTTRLASRHGACVLLASTHAVRRTPGRAMRRIALASAFTRRHARTPMRSQAPFSRALALGRAHLPGSSCLQRLVPRHVPYIAPCALEHPHCPPSSARRRCLPVADARGRTSTGRRSARAIRASRATGRGVGHGPTAADSRDARLAG